MSEPKAHLSITTEVKEALKSHRPVVALESTLVAHGLPYPQNLATAKALEDVIRSQGAVPAPIAVLEGTMRVGLSPSEWERIATDKAVEKVSRRDLAKALVRKTPGATTVAATMLIAHWAGISFFATGGIGGVHRGDSFDVSQDLFELAKTPVCVVSAGVKAILDVKATLETLEAYGVPVFTYQKDVFPAFYTDDSGLASPARIDDLTTLCAILDLHWRLGFNSGALLAVAPPKPLDKDQVELMVSEAITAAEKANISGKGLTPFLLSFLAEQSSGESLAANIALVEANAQVAARLAMAYSQDFSPGP